jgi:uncharacterized protein involved in exopolysaccharide biosynthesis
MGNEFMLDELFRYAMAKRRAVGIACVAAAAIAAAISLGMPKEYTAVTRVVVEPGPANPVRNATAENPQLLGVLGGYDQLIRSDRLFADLVQQTGIANDKNGLATRVLAPSRVIEIRYTTTDAARALVVAQAIANEAIQRSEATRKEALAQLAAEAGERHEDARSWAAFRGERIRLLDPGVVPAEASAPRLLLNVMSATLLALSLCGVALFLQYALRGRG